MQQIRYINSTAAFSTLSLTPAYDFDKVMARRLTRAVKRNTQLKWEDLV